MKLKNKKILVLGLANRKSIAWGILKKLKSEGASIGIGYFHPSNKKRVVPLSEEIGADFCHEIDVTKEGDILHLKKQVQSIWGELDGLVHSIAYSPHEGLDKPFSECQKQDFFQCLDISAYSLINLSHHFLEFLNPKASVIAMTYYGSQKTLPGYNLMGVAKSALETSARYLAYELGKSKGIRVNCISAGPIKTLAAVGIPKFSEFLGNVKEHSPLGENITIEDVGNLASFLLGTESTHITAQVHFVDSGMSSIVR